MTDYFGGQAFAELYDALQREANERGVCPKICNANTARPLHYCGLPLEPGKRFCLRHQFGV